MGAIAVTAADERKIAQLAERLGLRSRQRVVRVALAELESRAAQERLRRPEKRTTRVLEAAYVAGYRRRPEGTRRLAALARLAASVVNDE
ncbi:MAG TPA: hypothetical protein VF515_21855 [Candidatus Binatia bacterium]